MPTGCLGKPRKKQGRRGVSYKRVFPTFSLPNYAREGTLNTTALRCTRARASEKANRFRVKPGLCSIMGPRYA